MSAVAQRSKRASYAALEYAGGVGHLAWRTLTTLLTTPLEWRAFLRQIEVIGASSISIAVLTAIFSSMVMTVQFAVQMARFGAKDYVGNVVTLSLVRELGPVLTALMVGGRVGAGIAAELGSMAVTEQIDAIRAMGADPVRKLVVPRVLAAILSLPLLAVFADVLGVLGAMSISRITQGLNMRYFLNASLRSVGLNDTMGGLAKTVFFGLLISLIACYEGLSTTNGTQGVGRATTRTVVIASIAVLVSDFLLTNILIEIGL